MSLAVGRDSVCTPTIRGSYASAVSDAILRNEARRECAMRQSADEGILVVAARLSKVSVTKLAMLHKSHAISMVVKMLHGGSVLVLLQLTPGIDR